MYIENPSMMSLSLHRLDPGANFLLQIENEIIVNQNMVEVKDILV